MKIQHNYHTLIFIIIKTKKTVCSREKYQYQLSIDTIMEFDQDDPIMEFYQEMIDIIMELDQDDPIIEFDQEKISNVIPEFFEIQNDIDYNPGSEPKRIWKWQKGRDKRVGSLKRPSDNKKRIRKRVDKRVGVIRVIT